MTYLKFRALIYGRGLSIKDVHEGTGLSRTTISNLANGYSKGIEFDTLQKLVDFFQCEITEIIDIKPKETE